MTWKTKLQSNAAVLHFRMQWHCFFYFDASIQSHARQMIDSIMVGRFYSRIQHLCGYELYYNCRGTKIDQTKQPDGSTRVKVAH